MVTHATHGLAANTKTYCRVSELAPTGNDYDYDYGFESLGGRSEFGLNSTPLVLDCTDSFIRYFRELRLSSWW